MNTSGHWYVVVCGKSGCPEVWPDTECRTEEDAQELADELVCCDPYVWAAWPEYQAGEGR